MINNLSHIVKSLNGYVTSSTSGLCCCPAHDDKTPSLSISFIDSRWLVYCHAGCNFQSVMSALKSRGLLDNSNSYNPPPPVAKVAKPAKVNHNLEYAKKIWNETLPAENTLAEAYLRARGYTGNIPLSLRYHPNLKHFPSGKSRPAMVAAVTKYPSNKIIAIHRTFLSHDGKQKAPIRPPKMMLGNVSGCAVQFGKITSGTLIIAEGIETALSVYQATGIATIAALSAPNMPCVSLPSISEVQYLKIAADNDDAGIKFANILADKELAKGRLVKISLPPKGQDFNDILMNRGDLCL